MRSRAKFKLQPIHRIQCGRRYLAIVWRDGRIGIKWETRLRAGTGWTRKSDANRTMRAMKLLTSSTIGNLSSELTFVTSFQRASVDTAEVRVKRRKP